MNIFRYLLLILLFLNSAATNSQIKDAEFSITITNLRNNKGHVLVSVYKDGIGYPDEPKKAVRIAKLSIADNVTSVSFNGLLSGNYAIAILHDENDDSKMNKNFFGLPKEGYGFSNNVMGAFGPPPFSKASVQYNSNEKKNISISVRY